MHTNKKAYIHTRWRYCVMNQNHRITMDTAAKAPVFYHQQSRICSAAVMIRSLLPYCLCLRFQDSLPSIDR